MGFKEVYIKRFNDIETRQEFPLLTTQIKLLHENPKPFHYSNEADMLNRLVIGMTAKQFREAHGLQKGESSQPYLAQDQIQTLDVPQKIDIGLMLAMPNYGQRKRQLQWYLDRTGKIKAFPRSLLGGKSMRLETLGGQRRTADPLKISGFSFLVEVGGVEPLVKIFITIVALVILFCHVQIHVQMLSPSDQDRDGA